MTTAAATTVVRLRRRGGEVIQDCDVYIGRRCAQGGWNLPHSKWANPFNVRDVGSAAEAVRLYRAWITGRPELLSQIGELKGKRLGCWCKNGPNDPCHGDVLAELANMEGRDETKRKQRNKESLCNYCGKPLNPNGFHLCYRRNVY